MWSLVGKYNPSKILYLKYCQTKRDLLELPRLVKKAMENKCWKGRERWNTHILESWTCASGKWVILRHGCSSRYPIAHDWKSLSMDLSSKLSKIK
jgi:hypothetical protein